MELNLTIVNFSTPVQNYIPQVEERMRDQSDGVHPDLKAALNHLLKAGGKRVRPTITLLVGGMFGADLDRSITLAAAIELLHTATLVHDDMIDGALLRRGMPTLNSSWTPGATILTGDFIFARAAKLAAETDSVEVMTHFARTLSVIVNGEITQMFDSKGLASRENYFQRIHAKTASLFELAAMAPIHLMDDPGDIELLDAMNRYGYEIGMAFQIMDDILDFTSAANQLGKPVASDLRNGLITLPALCYFETHPDKDQVLTRLNGHGVNGKEIDQLVESIRNSGVIEQSLGEARDFVTRGLVALEGMPASVEKEALIELANYVVERPI
jgi:geranylgeranyl pyrophosphate synthase